MSPLNDRSMIYRLGKIILGAALIGICLFGVITSIAGANELTRHPITIRILAVIMELLGLHMAIFSEQYAQDGTAWSEKFLKNKPKIIQTLFGHYTSHTSNRFMTRLAGIFLVLAGSFLFLVTFLLTQQKP